MPMASLENTYNAEDLKERSERNEKIYTKEKEDTQKTETQHQISYIIEPKIDGLGIELVYKDGMLTK